MLPTHPVEELLWDIDQGWIGVEERRIVLRIVGSSALFLQPTTGGGPRTATCWRPLS